MTFAWISAVVAVRTCCESGRLGPGWTVAVQCPEPMMRGLLAFWLERQTGLVAVALSADGAELLRACEVHRPALIVLEADPVGWDAAHVLSRLRREGQARIIGLYHARRHSSTLHHLRTLGFDRLARYDAGLPSLNTAVGTLMDELRGAEPTAGVKLTGRERAVLRLLSGDRSASEIGAVLGIATGTVENCKRRLFVKLAAQSATQAVSTALRLGLLDDMDPGVGLPTGPLDGEANPATASPIRSSVSAPPLLTVLTPREREIVGLAAAGHSVKQTARALRISVKTVESTQRHLFAKLGVRGRSGAVLAVYGHRSSEVP